MPVLQTVVDVMVRVGRFPSQPLLEEILLLGAFSIEVGNEHRPDRLIPLDPVVEVIDDSFDDLASPDPLEKCLIGLERSNTTIESASVCNPMLRGHSVILNSGFPQIASAHPTRRMSRSSKLDTGSLSVQLDTMVQRCVGEPGCTARKRKVYSTTPHQNKPTETDVSNRSRLPSATTFTIVFLLFLVPDLPAVAQQEVIEHKELRFAAVDRRDLLLDLYVPESPRCLIVWVHGGRWWRGIRSSFPEGLVTRGYALASVDYRLATEAIFPAQVHDIKAAIRFLRAHAERYGYPGSPIAIAGASAGGHLAALVGVTNGDEAYEGRLGDHLDRSSSVQAILDLFGPTNLLTILDQSSIQGYKVRAPALALLLGGDPGAVQDLARRASPVFQVDSGDPPLLIIHGDQDIQVPINQSHELTGAYEEHGLRVRMKVIHGGGHGGVDSPEFLSEMDDFLSTVVN